MLNSKLNSCTDCVSIPGLLESIDCRLTELAKNQYNNIIFELNRKLPFEAMFDLVHYKQILLYRICNPEYAGCTSTSKIASRVKLLTHK